MTAIVDLESIARLRDISADVCDDVFRPPPQMTVSEWADANRILPRTSAEPGRWRTERVPYLRGVMDALGDETVREVLFIKSAQVGGTSCGENLIGYLIDQDPCGILMLWPTEKKLRSWSRKQLKPLLEDTEALLRKVPNSARRESGNTIAAKEFPGGFLQMLTAKSTSDLRSTSARYGIIEEYDEIDQEVKGQGDPVEQFDARFRTFWNAKQYKVSTPIDEETSRSWQDWLRSTQHRYVVPCPHCGHRQILRWRDGVDDLDEAGRYRLLWEEDEQGEVIPGSAAYLCAGCGVLIEEHHKMAMLLAGAWVPTFPGRRIWGFHINTLYSPLTAWDDIARAFVKARKSQDKMQTFVNLWLGLPFRRYEASLSTRELQDHEVDYPVDAAGERVLPYDVALLTAGVDVQGDRLELTVWGWGAEERAWLIAWEQLEGDPGQDDVWHDLDALLLRDWPHESGALLRIAAAAVDAGYQTERVHRFCDARAGRKVIAIVGRDGLGKPLLKAPGPQKFRRKKGDRAHRRPTHTVGVESAKSLLASRLRLTDPQAPGYVHFFTGLDRVFYDHLTAEHLKLIYVSGRPTRRWQKPKDRANEGLDCTVYAMAALAHLGTKVIAQLRTLATRVQELGAERLAQLAAAGGAPAAAPGPTARPTRRIISRGIDPW